MATLTVHRCSCGKRMSRYAARCVACDKARMANLRDKSRAVVATGACPDCGTKLIRNSALAGWWQCGAYATESYRKPEFRGLPKCGFQTFTE